MPTIDGDHKFIPTYPTYDELQAEVARLRVDLTHFTPASIERAAALEAENARLRQRVEELEPDLRGAYAASSEQFRRAEAAEAGMGHALPDQQCSPIEHKALRAEVERLKDDAILLESLQVATERERDKRDRQWREAFDQAFALRAEVERLRADMLLVKGERDDQATGRREAEAEVERLRAVVMDFHWLYGFFKDRGSMSDAVKTRLDKIDAALAPEVKP